MGVAESPFGSGASPVLTGDLVVVTRDYLPEPSMIAVSRTDGKLVWKTELVDRAQLGPHASHATPVIWRNEIILHRPAAVSAFSPEDGKRLWWIDTASMGTSTPSPAGEALYVTAFPGLADPANLPEIPPFSVLLSRFDRDQDRTLSREELPDDDLYVLRRAGMPDGVPGAHFTMKRAFALGLGKAQEDGSMNEASYDHLLATLMELGRPASSIGLLAIHPGGGVKPLEASVKWTYERNVPEVPAPVAYRGRVYMIISGGTVSCVSAEFGEVLYRGRVNARGAYYASPVAAGGKIFVASAEGVVTVLGSGDTLEVMANNDLGDPIYGTPAPAGSALYVRSVSHLWAFGTSSPDSRVD